MPVPQTLKSQTVHVVRSPLKDQLTVAKNKENPVTKSVMETVKDPIATVHPFNFVL